MLTLHGPPASLGVWSLEHQLNKWIDNITPGKSKIIKKISNRSVIQGRQPSSTSNSNNSTLTSLPCRKRGVSPLLNIYSSWETSTPEWDWTMEHGQLALDTIGKMNENGQTVGTLFLSQLLHHQLDIPYKVMQQSVLEAFKIAPLVPAWPNCDQASYSE